MRAIVGSPIRALLRILFVVFAAYPVVLLWLGIHVRHRERLPLKGPAIVAANHNSHLDILVLLSLFPLLCIPNVQPVAAADYFFRTPLLKWFALNVMGIVPVLREGVQDRRHPLEGCFEALAAGKVLIIFPEGTRGNADQGEQMAQIKLGLWYLAKRFPQAPVIPVYLHGLGKSMPKGHWIPIPFFIRIAVGKPLFWHAQKEVFIDNVKLRLMQLKEKVAPISENYEDQ
jgi:1-acyl-sn-glycerol-3-phosphate acyltransferase